MGGRALVAGFGAPAPVLLLALLVAGAGLVGKAWAETHPADLAATAPGAVKPAALSTSPASASPGEDKPAASPAGAPASEGGQEPADATDTAAPPPSEGAEQPTDTSATPPSETEPLADTSAATPNGDQPKPADTAAPAPGEDEQQQPTEAATLPAAQPAEGAPAPSVAEEQPAADPIVAAIRTKLQDPALRKGAAPDDLAALEAFYGARNGAPVWITSVGFSAKAQSLIAEIQNAGNWGLEPEAFHLPPASDLPATTEAQATDEIKLAFAVLKYARFAKGGRISPTRISVLFDQKPNLLDPKTVLTEIATSAAPAAYLTSLHPKHDQFERLRQLLIKAVASANAHGRKPASDPTIQRLVVNIERWRWMPPALGSYYVWNNIPAFSTRVVKDGKSIYVEKVIVGQLKYATPIFSADMRSIVFNPEWVVPETIKIEDLQPRLRQGRPGGEPDVSILRDNKLSVSYQGRPIDAETVDWSRANILDYTFTQPPGPDNVLGVLKFNFPNRHAVYMHDTLQPELFNETVRTLSHGCIRVRRPDRLATVLLAEDKGWSEEQVKSLLAKGDNSMVSLNRPVPVHLTYFTMAFDGVGRLQTYADIYGLDTKMASVLFGKSDALSVDREAGQQKRSAANGGGLGPLSGLFGN